MIFLKFSASELFQIVKVDESSLANKIRKINFPFNLDFKIIKMKNDSLKGPGVYFISFKGEVIYIGSYSSTKPNIIADRWKKHIMTFTNRGYRIGLSGMKNRSSIPITFKTYFDRDSEYRYVDTGTVTTLERLNFAALHFDNFKELRENDNLLDFEFFYLKLENTSIYSAKALEKILIKEFETIGNHIKKRKLSVSQQNIESIGNFFDKNKFFR